MSSQRVAIVDGATPVGAALARGTWGAGAEAVQLTLRQLDPRGAARSSRPRMLRDIEAIVWPAHIGDLARVTGSSEARRARVGDTTRRVVTATAATGIPHLVVVTSAMVYGASSDNPVPLGEDAPIRRHSDSGIVGDLLAVEDMLAQARSDHPGLQITSVRPAALVGPDIDTMVTRHFEAPRLLVVKGAPKVWQFCHVDDLAAACAHVVRHGLDPVVGVGCQGVLTQGEVESYTGMRRIELPEVVALGTAQRLHRLGLLPAPADDLAYAMNPWVVATERLTNSGWSPVYDNVTCLGVLLDGISGRMGIAGRRMERRDAAFGAASAAVAMVGTAALLRRTRNRKGSW